MQTLKKIKQRLTSLRADRATTVPVDVLTGYAQWAAHYPAEAHNPLMEIEQAAMLELLPEVGGKTCLDLACGSGRYLRLLQARGAASVTGLDYSAEMLGQATADSHQPTTDNGQRTTDRLIRSPFLPLPFTEAIFDIIVCGLGVGHEKNLANILAEAARILRPGGWLLYSDFHPFAALAGWRRSFAVNGTIFEVEHYVHLYRDHVRGCAAAGLTIDAVLEPAAGDHAPAGFQQTPVVLAIRACKPER